MKIFVPKEDLKERERERRIIRGSDEEVKGIETEATERGKVDANRD